MSETFVFEQARVCDYNELMDMLPASFRTHAPDHPPFELVFPDVYQPTEQEMANQFIARDGEKIISNVSLVPLQIIACGQKIEIGGLAGVATRPEYRDKGLMRQNLDHVLKVMIDRGYPFTWLSGERKRYQPWGYEAYSLDYRFSMNKRGVGFDKYVGELPGKLHEGKVDQLAWKTLWEQAKNFPELVACGKRTLQLCYQRIQNKILMVDGPQGAHVVIRDVAPKVLVAFAGDPRTVGMILAHKLQDEWENIDAYLPVYPNQFCPVFKDLMIDYALCRSGNLAILNLEKTLSLFAPHFDRRVSDLGLQGSARVIMGSARQIERQEVVLRADGNRLEILPGSTNIQGPTVELTCHQAVELLFSPLCIGWSYRLEPAARWLAALMPVPLYFPPICRV